eukprot:TRINITY_DN1044_c0_g1_i1.p1 TRINITY_DN1044_c0_g1~~TRINITY_DN1044_c0_g1_i1.p1  ORF type:complete len:982 (-),score=189.66 TRINITY_DN1044_c0_g1_i1:32-2977(-)
MAEQLTPAHAQMVFQLLQNNMHQDVSIREPAMQELARCEKISGFCSILYMIIANKEVEQRTRLVAAIHFKNIVNKYWRTRREAGSLCEEEKHTIRSKLLALINEEDEHIASMVALLISKVARLDYPQKWPDILPQLLDAVQSAGHGTLLQLRALQTLRYTIQSLSSRRLADCRIQFMEITPRIFEYLGEFWHTTNTSILSSLSDFAQGKLTQQQVNDLVPVATGSRRALRILKDLLIHGFPKFNDVPTVFTFMERLLAGMKACLDCRRALPTNPLSKHVDKLLTLSARIVCEAHTSCTESFNPFLPTFLEFIHAQVLGPSPTPPFDRYLVHCVNFLKDTIGPYQITGALKHGEIVKWFFTDDRVKELTQVLVSRYFVLSDEELSHWEDNPELFFNISDQDEMCWESQLRASAETLMATVLIHYRDPVAPVLVQMLQHVLQDHKSDPSHLKQHLLLKEATYLAIGLGWSSMYSHIQFDSLLQNHLLPEMSLTDPIYKIVHRRVVAMIGSWVAEIPDNMRQHCYSVLVACMSNTNKAGGPNDIVVRLTAADSLQCLVNDCKFYVEPFEPFLDGAVQSLFQLIESVEEEETKLRVLSIFCSLCQQLGPRIRPYADKILRCLSQLWEISNNLMKTAIVRTLKKLVQSLGGEACKYSAFIIPVIRYSTDLNHPESLYLIEDGLGLWLHTIRQARVATPELLSVFPNIITILSRTFEYLKVCFKLLECYCLLGKEAFLASYGEDIIRLVTSVVGSVKDAGTVMLCHVLVPFVQQFPNEVPQMMYPIMEKMLGLIFSEKETDYAVTHYLAVFARILLDSPHVFVSFFERASQSAMNPSKQNVMLPFLDVWLDKVDFIGGIYQRQLTANALTLLLNHPDPEVLQRAPVIINVVVDVFTDVSARGIHPPSDDPENPMLSAVEKERTRLYNQDPVNRNDIRTNALQKLEELSNAQPEMFQAVIASTNATIMEQLKNPPDPAALPGNGGIVF